MRVFREITFSIPSPLHKDVNSQLAAFCNQLSSYKYLEKESTNYSKEIRGLGIIVFSERTPINEPANIAIAEKKKGKLFVANIVPREKPKLSMSEYNSIASMFFEDFKNFLLQTQNSLSISISKENIGLDDIIHGKKTRAYFERYLNAFPLSYHSNDIERLDFFICALRRYHPIVKLEHLERYLNEDLSWDKKDAKWCVNRIRTGLDVLAANWRFH